MQTDTRSGMDGLRRILAAPFLLAARGMMRARRIPAEHGIRTETIRCTLLTASWSFLLLVSAGLLPMLWLPADPRFLERYKQEFADQSDIFKPGACKGFPDSKEVTP